MAAKRDYYEVLGVTRDADLKTIKSAYRKLALKYHPDRNPGDATAEENFKEAAEAYEVLTDDNKRALYDRAGFDGLRSGGFSPFQGDLGDIFAQFGDIFSEFFGGGGGGGFGFGGMGPRGPRPAVGADLREDITIRLEDVMVGITEKLTTKRAATCRACSGTGGEGGEIVTCAACGGRGQVVQGRGGFMIATTCRACGGLGRMPKDPCKKCNGHGQVEETRTLEVKVPPGVETGVRLRLQGEGHAGSYGGPPGDLYVFVTVEAHDTFVRHGPDLHCELSISFRTACLGGPAKLPKLLEGEIDVRVPGGSQPGDVVRVKGEGLPQLGTRGVGDVLAHLTIFVPTEVTDEQKRVLEDLEQVMPFTSAVSAGGPDRRETKRRRKKSGGLFDRLRDALEGD